MKKIKTKLLENLTPKQRLILAWEAKGREDEAEFSRLQDTCPRKSYTGPELTFRHSWDCIVSMSLAVEADLRGYALSWIMAIRAKEIALAEKFLSKILATEKRWTDLLHEIGLSEAAIKAARPEQHHMVETLLNLHKSDIDPEELEAQDKIFKEVRKNIPVLNNQYGAEED